MEAKGLAETFMVRPEAEGVLEQMGVFNQFDVVVFERHAKDMTRYMERARGVGAAVVYDIDDDIFHVLPANPAYVQFGTSKRLLREAWEALQGSPPETLGQLAPFAYMSFEELLEHNQSCRRAIVENMKAADAVTVTTEALKKQYKNIARRVEVLPNLADLDEWKDWVPVRPNDGKVRIAWAGGDSHMDDLALLRDPIKDLLAKYEHVEFHIIGFPDAKRILWDGVDRVIAHPWLEHNDLKRELSKADIGVAPSVPVAFNEAKSPIRVYEILLATGGHAAVVGSKTTYGETINKLGCGLVVRGNGVLEKRRWFKALSELVENEEKRREMGKKGFDALMHDPQWSYQGQAELWADLYSELAERAKEAFRAQGGG